MEPYGLGALAPSYDKQGRLRFYDKKRTREVAEALERHQLKKYGVIDANDRSEDATRPSGVMKRGSATDSAPQTPAPPPPETPLEEL
jgi:hypothetical protein